MARVLPALSEGFSLRNGPAEQQRGSFVTPLITTDGPVLFFGGPYGNLEALQALIAEAKRLGIGPERMICTGDVVAYCADGAPSVDLIRELGLHTVMGNCEESLGYGKSDCGCGFPEGSACEAFAASWYAAARAALSENHCAWMRTLPRRIDVQIGKRRLAVVHGSPKSIGEFVFASASAAALTPLLDEAGCDGVVAGHTGLPFTRTIHGRLWHNPGAIGLPANDGTRRTWFSVMEPANGGIRIRHLPLVHDAKKAAAKMRTRGSTDYASALEIGLWPSCDVLPAAELARRGHALVPGDVAWSDSDVAWPNPPAVAAQRPKFSDPQWTATGERRATVALDGLRTLWINTGTLCNLTCHNCYIESSPRNDRLAYISRNEVQTFLTEAKADRPELVEIGFTGGEPFMNPDILGMIDDALVAGYRVLILTNAMRPMRRLEKALLEIHTRFPGKLTIRVSLDHYTKERHESLRGARSWAPTVEGLRWLAANGFNIAVAGRTVWNEPEADMRAAYRRVLEAMGVSLDASDPERLVLFPEMDQRDVPEITERCWGTLHKRPESVMCAHSRMIVKRKGAARPEVVSCTLLPYDDAFSLGQTLAEASRAVPLNHRYCARFCVLGGASCS